MLKFGDVIFRPCISYAGKTNFVNPQIVTDVFERNGETYVRSKDFIGQTWTDNILDLDNSIFLSKEKANDKLIQKMIEKAREENERRMQK